MVIPALPLAVNPLIVTVTVPKFSPSLHPPLRRAGGKDFSWLLL
jgi:hypothetical protein